MLLSELPLSILFLFFLLLFILIGLYPAWKRVAAKIRRLKGHGKLDRPATERFRSDRASTFVRAQATSRLNIHEMIVFRQLAHSSAKGLTRKQIGTDLHLEPVNVNQALKSLSRRGLVSVAVNPLFRVRFYLSEKGYRYAGEQDFIPIIQKNKNRR